MANFTKENKTNRFEIVEKASNPAASDAIKNDFHAGLVSEINVTLKYGYIQKNSQTALIRSAYLILFRHTGYNYARHEVVQSIRRGISDLSFTEAQLNSLIGRIHGRDLPPEQPYFFAYCTVDGTDFMMIIIRLKIKTMHHLSVFLPHPDSPTPRFFETIEKLTPMANYKISHIYWGE